MWVLNRRSEYTLSLALWYQGRLIRVSWLLWRHKKDFHFWRKKKVIASILDVRYLVYHLRGNFSSKWLTCGDLISCAFFQRRWSIDTKRRQTIRIKGVLLLSVGGNYIKQSYSATEKECPAVVEVLKSYRSYPLGNQFDLYTDHQSLKWLLTRTKEHSGRLWRWMDKIRDFRFFG